MRTVVLLCVAILAIAGTAGAQTPPEEAAAPAETKKPWFEAVTVNGLVDGYYSFATAGDPRAPSVLRVFDGDNGSFTMAYSEVAIAMAAEPAGFRVDLGFGPVADATRSFQIVYVDDDNDPLTPDVPVGAPNDSLRNVQQAYVSINPWGKLTVDVGKFVTTAGAEVIEAKDNWNYTRSTMFGYAIPYAHTGARLTAPINANLTLQASLVNGWDVVPDNNRGKTLGLFALYSGGPMNLSAWGGTYVGPEQVKVPGEDLENRMLVDAGVGIDPIPHLSLKLNVDYGSEEIADEDESWTAFAFYAKYALHARASVALRLDSFTDSENAVRTGASDLENGDPLKTVNSATLTFGFPFGSQAEVRAELRNDMATQKIYFDGEEPTDSQMTAHVGLMAWF